MKIKTSIIFIVMLAMFFNIHEILADNNGVNVKDDGQFLEFINPWMKPPIAPNKNSAMYVTIKNHSNNNYSLVNAHAASIANNVELHQSFIDENGIGRMISINKIVIPAHSEIVLKPGGIHIMLFDINRHITLGEEIPIVLVFESIGQITVNAIAAYAAP
ncbi:MAG: copper chaperone PCu(A)C [Rickettsiaceae bacterium]